MRCLVSAGIALLALSTYAGSAFAAGRVSEPIERSPDMVAPIKHAPKVKKTKAHNKPGHMEILGGVDRPHREVAHPEPTFPGDPERPYGRPGSDTGRRPAGLDRPEKDSDTYLEIMRHWVHEKFPDQREYTKTDPNGGEPVSGAARGGARDVGEMSHSKELGGGNIGDFRHSQPRESTGHSSDSTKDSTTHESAGDKDTGTDRDPGRAKSN